MTQRKTLVLSVIMCFLFFWIFGCNKKETVKIGLNIVAKGGGLNNPVGFVTAKDTKYGLLLVPDLKGLPPGILGFHVHANPSCENFGESAGSHLDPEKTNKHLGPYEHGHLGDLPVLIVDKQGRAKLPVLAPRLSVKSIVGHSLMIHQGKDNYSDYPKANGGGGARLACGVIPKG